MNKKFLLCIMIMLFLNASHLIAGTTGKIAGRILDAESNGPLPGVNVIIKGTQMGAASDISGNYFILNIPPGIYEIEASMIGYGKSVVTNVRVSIDRTTTVNFNLKQKVLQAGEVVVVAEREKVRTDVSFSQTAITTKDIKAVPTSPDIKEVIALSAGVYRNDRGQIEIRGGHMDEVGVYVDDISMQDQRSGMPVLNLPQEAIQEIQIIRGGFSAEYGQAQSGIINIVTKEGKKSYNGSINFRFGPKQQKHFGPNYFSPDNFWHVGRFLSMDSVFTTMPWLEGKRGKELAFQGWQSWWQDTTAEKIDKYYPDKTFPYGQSAEDALEIWKWRHRPQDYGNKPDINLDATLSGPVPFTGDKLTFFATGHYNRSIYPFKFYRPDYTEYSGNLKLKYHLSENMTLTYHGIFSRQDGTSLYSGAENMADPRYWISSARLMGQIFAQGDIGPSFYIGDGLTKLNRISKLNNTLKFQHVINPSSFYEAQFTHSLTTERMDRDIKYRNLTNIVKVVGGDSLDVAPFKPYSYLDGKFVGPKDIQSIFYMGGTAADRNYDFSWNETFTFKLDYTNQINSIHQLKTGIWGFRNVMYLDYGARNTGQKIDGSPDPDNYAFRSWLKRKIPYYEFAAYVQDKVEFEGLVLNAGLRMDGMKNNEPNFPLWSRYYNVGPVEDSLYTMPESIAPRNNTKIYLSPRLGVSHPLSENSKLFFNYGYFYQRATIAQLFRDAYIPNSASGLSGLSNAALDFRKTIQYELGFEQMVKDWFRITLSGYYRDGSNEITSTTLASLAGTRYWRNFNTGFSDIKGFEVDIRLPQHYYFSGWLNYDYRTKTSGRYGYDFYYQDPNIEPLKTDATPTVTKARPTLRANLMLHSPDFTKNTFLHAVFSKMTASFLYQWRAGQWITYHHPVYWPGSDKLDPQNLQWQDWSRLDLRITKDIHFGGSRLSIYMDVRNLLNKKYFYPSLIGFLNSGKDFTKINRNEYLEEIGRLGLKPGNVEHPEIKKMLEHGPYWIFFGEPRLFWFGMEFSF